MQNPMRLQPREPPRPAQLSRARQRAHPRNPQRAENTKRSDESRKHTNFEVASDRSQPRGQKESHRETCRKMHYPALSRRFIRPQPSFELNNIHILHPMSAFGTSP